MEALTCGNTEIAPQDLRIAMNKLARTKKSSKRTGYEQEFKVVNPSSLQFIINVQKYRDCPSGLKNRNEQACQN